MLKINTKHSARFSLIYVFIESIFSNFAINFLQILDFHEIIHQFWELNDEVYILVVVTTFTMKGDYPGITGIKYNKYLYLVSWPCGQDELTVRVEGQTVDLCGVGVHNVTGLGRVVWPCVPSVKVKHILRSLNTRHY